MLLTTHERKSLGQEISWAAKVEIGSSLSRFKRRGWHQDGGAKRWKRKVGHHQRGNGMRNESRGFTRRYRRWMWGACIDILLLCFNTGWQRRGGQPALALRQRRVSALRSESPGWKWKLRCQTLSPTSVFCLLLSDLIPARTRASQPPRLYSQLFVFLLNCCVCRSNIKGHGAGKNKQIHICPLSIWTWARNTDGKPFLISEAFIWLTNAWHIKGGKHIASHFCSVPCKAAC